MNKIYQTDDVFPSDIRKFGCYFMSLMFMLASMFGKPLWTHGALIDLYNKEEVDLDMTKEAFMADPVGICECALGFKRVTSVRVEAAGYLPKAGEFIIQRWYNPRTDFHHFVAADKTGKVTYDPIEGGSVTVREGRWDSTRVFTYA